RLDRLGSVGAIDGERGGAAQEPGRRARIVSLERLPSGVLEACGGARGELPGVGGTQFRTQVRRLLEVPGDDGVEPGDVAGRLVEIGGEARVERRAPRLRERAVRGLLDERVPERPASARGEDVAEARRRPAAGRARLFDELEPLERAERDDE